MEAAIDANTSDINLLVTGLGGDINNIEVDALPDQTGANGKFLTTDGNDASWADVPEYDDQSVKNDIAKNASDIATKYDAGVVPAGDSRTYNDAYALEKAVLQNAEDIADIDPTDTGAVHTLENADDTSLKCTGIMTLTQAQYDALDGSRNPEVLYLVVG